MELEIGFADRREGGRLAFARAGDGPPLLVPPAWVTSLASLASGVDPRSAFLRRLGEHFCLILYDRGGMGLSAGPLGARSPDGDVDEILTVMDAVEVERAPVLALSQSGPTAVRLAQRHPDRCSGLVLMGTYGSGPRLYHREDVRESMLALVRASWGLGSELLAHLIVPDATAEQARAFARLQREAATPERAAKVLEGFFAADVTEALPRLSLPVLVLHYEGDRAVPARGGRELASLIPDARLVLLPGDAHLPRAADLDRLVDEIVDFLSGPVDQDEPPAR